ncbi:hypothetical protein BBK36DRAFT_1107861 [Trichoderma citrinoviride]|uniref:Uncharacterized protein n=1 Tax=Trichoderma citrinoviride TaxID=58853 RepID=A0A2T4BNM9_9HYPO|nr:hypothetical protein BBK36DRAFT_1107861 [Trichoderma citrinoviride]PTB70896.1 hypothetical protein BBK36DRAFT_1107861 [Trichoderma citrinoviride]
MCEVTRTKYACRHNIIEYKTRCANQGNRCEKKIENRTSEDSCPKCNPDSRHKKIADLYATYGNELARLAELARVEDCQTMVMQLERMQRGLAEERIRALVELQEKIEGEAAVRRRAEEEEAAKGSGW